MTITPIRTDKISAGTISLLELIDQAVTDCPEGSVLAVTSKIVSLCENSVVPLAEGDKEQLVIENSQYYLPAELSSYGHHFTIASDTLIAMGGIDESNGDGNYVLWPKDAWASANQVRAHLVERFGLKEVGVIITDSTCQPLRRGTAGITLSHSGFKALRDYRDQVDLFGRQYAVTEANISGGLSAAAVLAMGEGNEMTPLCLLTDLPFVEFQPRDPSAEEIADLRIPLDEDLFAPFLKAVDWKRGKQDA
jgi:F420-0:gamma-glutamyl ligase